MSDVFRDPDSAEETRLRDELEAALVRENELLADLVALQAELDKTRNMNMVVARAAALEEAAAVCGALNDRPGMEIRAAILALKDGQ